MHERVVKEKRSKRRMGKRSSDNDEVQVEGTRRGENTRGKADQEEEEERKVERQEEVRGRWGSKDNREAREVKWEWTEREAGKGKGRRAGLEGGWRRRGGEGRGMGTCKEVGKLIK